MLKLKWRLVSWSASLLCRMTNRVEKTTWIQASSCKVLGALASTIWPFDPRWLTTLVLAQMLTLTSKINILRVMKKIPFTITHKHFASHSLGILPVQQFIFLKMPLGNIVGLFLTAQIPEHLYYVCRHIVHVRKPASITNACNGQLCQVQMMQWAQGENYMLCQKGWKKSNSALSLGRKKTAICLLHVWVKCE